MTTTTKKKNNTKALNGDHSPLYVCRLYAKIMAQAKSQSASHLLPLFCNEYPTPIITTAKLSCPN